VTYQSFNHKWFAVEEKGQMLLGVFQHHNDQIRELAGKDYSKGILQNDQIKFI
jgi:hypothetical protein